MYFDAIILSFSITVHAVVGQNARDNKTTDRFAHSAISPLRISSAAGLESPEGTAAVTLPGRSEADGKRRDFGLELPWELEYGDFFGVITEY